MAEQLDRLVRAYRKIRDKKADLAKEHKDEVAGLDKQLKVIEQALLQHCKDSGSSGGKTPFGTFSRTERSKYWTSDWERFHGFLLENNELGLLEKRISRVNLEAYLEEHPDAVLPGLNKDVEYAIVVRKPTGRE